MTYEVVWESKLDEKYDIKVTRTGDYTAMLTIAEGGTVLHSQEVGLAYRAIFGPDVDDVATWQNIAVDFVDKKGG